jgi:hypothetical protein
VSRASKFDSSPSLQPDNGYVTCIFYFPSGLYDTQYAQRTAPECRGRLKTDSEGKYGYRAVVPAPYFIRHDVGPSFLPLVSTLLTAPIRNRARWASSFSPWDDIMPDRITCT